MFGEPSRSISSRSTPRWSSASIPSRASPISSLTWPTALAHALAAVAVAAVAELDRLELAGGRARRDDGPAGGAGREEHLDLDGGVAARVEDLPPGDVLDG